MFEQYVQFMYTRDNIDRISREYEEFISKKSDNKFFNREQSLTQPVKRQKERKNKHPVFWLLYKMVKVEKFFEKKSHDDIEEINFRIKFVETIKKENGLMKANKIKISQVEGEAMNSCDIPLLGAFFNAVCIYYKLSLIVIKGNIYKTIMCEPDDVPTHIVEYDGSQFMLFSNNLEQKAKHARENMFEFSKPLRAISGYKVDELKDVARRVGIPDSDVNGILKKQIYEKILSRLSF